LRRNRYPAILASLIAVALVGAACQPARQAPPAEETPEVTTISIGECVTSPDEAVPLTAAKGVDFKTQLKEQGKLTVGSDIAYQPFESVDPATNQPVGFDVDLGNEIAKRLGLQAEFVNTSFDALFTQSLPQGQFDVGISAITVKAERQGSIDFTVPYFKADLSLAVEKESGTRLPFPPISKIEDLEGKLIGAQAGTTGEDCSNVVKDMVGASDVRTFETALQAFDDLAARRVAGVINDLPVSRQIVAERTNLAVVQIIETEEVYGIAVGKQKPDLRVAINKALTDMFNDGTFANIYKKWFDLEPPFPLPPADFPN
jgi:ABC-type amino acid transport substrate-binding protein